LLRIKWKVLYFVHTNSIVSLIQHFSYPNALGSSMFKLVTSYRTLNTN